jgi:alpha-tubulin suppressor-like RCC1 family protein
VQGQSNVPADLVGVVAIGAGLAHSMALKADGTVVVWGWDYSGLKHVPSGLTNVVGIAAGSSHCLALKADGPVVAWGDGYAGATTVPASLTNVVALAGGSSCSLALKADGAVVAWGTTQTNVPAGLKNVLSIAAGNGRSLALVGDGPPVQQALVSNPTWNSNGFEMCLPSQSGHTYALEYKDSLSSPDWNTLPLAAGNGGTLKLTDPVPANPQRFYRVRRW